MENWGRLDRTRTERGVGLGLTGQDTDRKGCRVGVDWSGHGPKGV